MPTSDASWSGRLRLIGDLERPDHHHLEAGDQCAFFGEYTPGEGWKHSSTNNLILNLKNVPRTTRNTAQWPHKLAAIRDAAAAIRANLDPQRAATTLLVPIPSSKTAVHPDYDPRMLHVAESAGAPFCCAELLRTVIDRAALHGAAERRDPEALATTMACEAHLLAPGIERIILIDDMITTGCSFRACRNIIADQWPSMPVFGLFISRRVLPNPFAAFTDLIP